MLRRFDPAMAIADFRRLDREFHATVAAACGNPLLLELYTKVLDRLFRSEVFDSLLGSVSNRPQRQTIIAESVEHDRRIAAAFAAADTDTMISAARAHLAAVEQRMVEQPL